MRLVLELLRIMVIVFIIGAVGTSIIVQMYKTYDISENYHWMSGIAMLLLLFVWYRNKWQFSGWYRGKKGEKLSNSVSFTLICLSILLIIVPFILEGIVK